MVHIHCNRNTAPFTPCSLFRDCTEIIWDVKGAHKTDKIKYFFFLLKEEYSNLFQRYLLLP